MKRIGEDVIRWQLIDMAANLNYAIVFHCKPEKAEQIFNQLLNDPDVFIMGQLFESKKKLWVSERGV